MKCSEERYRRLLEQSFDAVVIHKQGKIVVANEVTAALAGASSPEDLVGRSIYDFVHPVSHQFVKERLADLGGTGDGLTFQRVRETFLRLDGTPVDVEVMSTWFMDNGIPAVQVVFRAISPEEKADLPTLHEDASCTSGCPPSREEILGK